MLRKSLFPLALMVALAVVLSVAACNDAPSPTAPPPPTENSTAAPGSASLVAGEPGGVPEAGFEPGVMGQAVPVEMAAQGGACSDKKVAICHVPPGNQGNVHEICILTNAEPAHLAHGDYAPLSFWPDLDGDGFGDASAPGESGCIVPAGSVEDNSDCDDDDSDVNPGAEEICDGVDNDCNGTVDDGGDALCDNGVFCDGAEVCGGVDQCQPGTPPTCDDAVPCTDDSCNPLTDSCDNFASNANCDDGQFCNGAETCDPVNNCQDGTPPCDLETETCNEDADICEDVGVACPCDYDLVVFDGGLRIKQCRDIALVTSIQWRGDMNDTNANEFIDALRAFRGPICSVWDQAGASRGTTYRISVTEAELEACRMEIRARQTPLLCPDGVEK